MQKRGGSMEIVGIIAEYNPLHNGHIYHINEIKKKYPESLIVLVLNGYFTERGEVSIINKEHKVKLALENNIDIILELPLVFGTQSADVFAEKSLELLNHFGVNRIIFGSESCDIDALTKIASNQLNNPEFDQLVKNNLRLGMNYPTSLAKASKIDFSFLPNDLLAISYIKAILKNNYNIVTEPIKRTNSYHDTLSDNEIISATNIRERLKNGKDISYYLPSNTLNYIENININDYFAILKYKILTDKNLSIYLDVDEGIENRLQKVILDATNIDELIKLVKSKRYTYNKINRMLVHILLGLTKCDRDELKLEYIKVLGFNQKGMTYINKIKKQLDISLKQNKKSKQYQYELKAALLYDMISKYDSYKFEIKNEPIKEGL